MVKNSWYPVIFLTVIAAVFRIFFIDLIEFKFDEAQALFVISEFLAHPYFIQIAGVSSIGVNYFPLQYYLLAILGLLTTNPMGLSFLIAVVNTLLIPVFYLIIKKYYGQLIGFAASGVLALSPWSIIYSRKIWNPDLILVLLIPAIYFLHRVIIDHSKKALLPLFALLILLVQLQFSGIFFLLVTFFVLWFTKTKINLAKIATGLLLGLIPAVPYLWYQVTSTPLCKDCVALFSYQGVTKTFDFNNFLRPLEIITGSYFENLLGNDYATFLNQFPFVKVINLLFLIQMVIPLVGLYFVIKNRQHLFLAIYVVLIPFLYLITATPARMYYFIILSPFIAILYGLGVKLITDGASQSSLKIATCLPTGRCRVAPRNDKWKNTYPTIRYTLYAIFFLPLVTNLIFMSFFFIFVSEKKIIDGDFGAIFPVTRDFVESALADYENLDDYDHLKTYSYMFANHSMIHSKIGEYFAQKQQPNLAKTEFQKALKENPEDLAAMANLTYILILTGNITEANHYLDQLKINDPVNGAKLEQVMQQVKIQQQQATQSGTLK